MSAQQPLIGKNILLGISGGIAAYKCAELTRRLKEQGAEVRIVMTKSSKEFITPLTMQAVSGHAIADNLLDPSAEAGMSHIELAKWADLILLAPATANLIARLRAGFADELLTTLCLASPAPIAVAPAMNMEMYLAPATQENISVLADRGLHIWGPGKGAQACGDIGPGRLLEPEDLVNRVSDFFTTEEQVLSGINITITAGPTLEALDPVRYISNHSSGKMGFAIAKAAQLAGAEVTIISGPVNIPPPENCKVINIESAQQMHQQALITAKNADVFIACAAVADYRVAAIADQKIKKTTNELQLNLVKNPDIVADIAALADKPFTVGFAAETQDVAQYALGKLTRKNLDMIAANNVALAGQGFNSDDNALTVFDHHSSTELPLANKEQLAVSLVSLIDQKLKARTQK